MGRIDTHLHIWSEPAEYAWLSDDLAPINRPIEVAEARDASALFGFEQAVLVQAADTDADTDYLLSLADAHDWILGVVGWVPLTDPQAAAERLEELADKQLVGIRALIHDQPDPRLLDRPEVRETLGLIAENGLAFEIPDAFPDQLAAASRVADAMPDLCMVLDHLGKPPVGDLREWASQLRDFAAHDNTHAKLSGLHQGGAVLPFTHALEACGVAVEAFGTARIMLGSDFPMPLLGDGVHALAAQLDELLEETMSPLEIDYVGSRNAEDIYGLAAVPLD